MTPDDRLARAERARRRLLSVKLVGAAWMLLIVATVILATVPAERVERQCAPRTECVKVQHLPALTPSDGAWIAIGAVLLLPGAGLLLASRSPR